MSENKPVTAVVIGAGLRGKDSYGVYGLKYPERINFVAVAEPDEGRRRMFQEKHDIPDNLAFESWEQLLEQEKLADVAFITTQDHMHYEPAIKALELDYDLLLEKPIAPTLEQCQHIENLARERGRLVQVGHVLRFSHFWKKVKEIIDTGRIGKVIHYEHSENVSYWHFGHSFVRGLYKNKADSNPLILSKSCHDLDLMQWYLGDPIDVSATGDLSYYKPENAPPDAPERCTDGCPYEKECPWNAVRLYMIAEELIRIGAESDKRLLRFGSKLMLNHRGFIKFLSLFIKSLKNVLNWQMFPATFLGSDLTVEGKMKALREGRYGLCIYKCGNDVVDHMISNFRFADGVTGTLIVHGLSEHEGRELRVFGSKGTIRGFFRSYGEELIVTDHRYRNSEIVLKGQLNIESGHGGSDFLLMNAFTSVLLGEKTVEEAGLTTISSAMESHYMGFAAEESMIQKETKNIADFRPK